jgi:acyl carrier protein
MGLFAKAETTDARVIKLVREVLPWQAAKKEIRPEMALRAELGIDSLGKVALAARLEEEFGIEFARFQGDVAAIRTVADVVAAVEQLRGA